MKKYIILTFISLSIILTAIATGYTKINSIEYVSAVKVEKTKAVEILNYNGTVEYRNSYAATSDGTGMVQSVLVNNGDFIEKGEPVLTVLQTDRELSKSDIMSAITSGDYDSISKMLEGDLSVKVYEARTSGLVSSLDLEEGGVFQKGQTLFKISPEQSFQIQINVIEKDIPKIKIGQKVKIDCKAVSSILYGEISAIGSTAKQTATATGKETTVKVTVKIDEENEEIKSGYTAICSITVSEKENTVLVPYSSVGTDDNGKSFVYILNDKKIKKSCVSCGKEYSNGLEITKGLKDCDIIVSDISKVSDLNNTVVNEVRINAQ